MKLLILSGAASVQAAVPTEATRKRKNRLAFDEHVGARRLGIGWVVWGKLIAVGKYSTPIVPVEVEFATDRSFSQVVATIKISATQSNGYFLNAFYEPNQRNSELHFRFSAYSNDKHGGEHIPRYRTSPIGTIAPWNA